MREISWFRAMVPERAWKNGRPPRERRKRRHAVDDLIGALDRYLAKLSAGELLLTQLDSGGLVRSDYTDRARLRQWTVWAARLADPWVRHGFGPAPDGSEWWIKQRIEYP